MKNSESPISDQVGITPGTIGYVAIGRNEGERLVRCLSALKKLSHRVVYVDSASDDDSVQWANKNDIQCLELDMDRPFTAARARNEGFAALMAAYPDTDLVMFIDGDCEVDPEFPGKAAAKRWDYVRKGAPIIIEVGSRDMEAGAVSLIRRDQLWDMETGKANFQTPQRDDVAATIGATLEDIQTALFDEAAARRDANITRGVTSMDEVAAHYSTDAKYPGWLEVQWSKPTGAALEKVVETLKEHKLTIRNVPIGADAADGPCIFTGDPAFERILVARAY